MTFNFLNGWNIDNSIQTLLLITAAVSIYLLYKTLKAGQHQAEQSNELTRQNLSISQYQIYMEELKYFIKMFQELQFPVTPATFHRSDYRTDIQNSNGIDYMLTIKYVIDPEHYFLNSDRTENTERVNEFRHNILFPLFRKYAQLHNFLQRIKADQLLKDEHKKLLYLLIERDLLQNYFRLCNNEFPDNTKNYDLSLFETQVFRIESLHAVNRFFIDNDLFALHSLQFYKETL